MMSKEQKEKEEQKKLDRKYHLEHCGFDLHKNLEPLKTLKKEFDPNFLERLGVQGNVKDLIGKVYGGRLDENHYEMIAAITAELFYIKACVNCMDAFDPVGARVNAYLATVGYDIYVTTLSWRKTDEAIQAREVNETEAAPKKPAFVRFLQTFMTKKSKVPLKTKRTKRSHHEGTLLTLKQRVGKVQEDSKIYLLKGERLTIGKFIKEAYKFAEVADVDAQLPIVERLAHFAENLLYPFAYQCNHEARQFYTSLRPMPFQVNFLEKFPETVKQFNLIAGETKSSRYPIGGSRAQSWIEDLFGIVTRYQMSFTKGKFINLNLRTFRKGYAIAKATRRKGTEVSDKFYEETKFRSKKASPFLQLDFLFKLYDESIFDCFDPKKVNEKNIQQLLKAVGAARDLELSEDELVDIADTEFSVDNTVANAIAFEKLIGKNLYRRSISKKR